MLVANEPITQGLQYGAGIGAWVGFGFGLFDTFVLAKRSYAPRGTASLMPAKASGLIGLTLDQSTSLGFINPNLIQQVEMDDSGYRRAFHPVVDLLNVRINL